MSCIQLRADTITKDAMAASSVISERSRSSSSRWLAPQKSATIRSGSYSAQLRFSSSRLVHNDVPVKLILHRLDQERRTLASSSKR